MNTILRNRKEAGGRLALELTEYVERPETIVLGLARGGVPVAHEIAKKLHLPLDVCLVKKLGLPWNREVAVGVVAEEALLHNYTGSITILDEKKPQLYGLDRETVRAMAAMAKAELRWRDRCYRHYRPMMSISNRIVIVVDDGIGTGLTMQAAVKVLRKHLPQKIIVAAPIVSTGAIERLKTEVDDIISLVTPQWGAISFWYKDYHPISDREVCNLLSQKTPIGSENSNNEVVPYPYRESESTVFPTDLKNSAIENPSAVMATVATQNHRSKAIVTNR